MKILNLYAGIGGNRKLWGDDHDITAVELDPKIAAIYKDFFPNDTVIVGDAHQYLLDHYKEFDFIWSSPPCPSHSRARFWATSPKTKIKPIYPDMKLYQEILFLKHYSKGAWLVENVKPFYTPLISSYKSIGRHLFWSSISLRKVKTEIEVFPKDDIIRMQKINGIDLKDFTINKTKALRNCVNPEIGLAIMEQFLGIHDDNKINQIGLFAQDT